MELPDKFSNPIWLGVAMTVLMALFVLFLMGVGMLLS